MIADRGVSASRVSDGVIAALARWVQRRRARRRRIARAVWDLRERYGAAAYAIARNSARAPVGGESRRFWRQVARRLRAA